MIEYTVTGQQLKDSFNKDVHDTADYLALLDYISPYNITLLFEIKEDDEGIVVLCLTTQRMFCISNIENKNNFLGKLVHVVEIKNGQKRNVLARFENYSANQIKMSLVCLGFRPIAYNNKEWLMKNKEGDLVTVS